MPPSRSTGLGNLSHMNDSHVSVQVQNSQPKKIHPKPGQRVMVGQDSKHRFVQGTLLGIDETKFLAQVRLRNAAKEVIWLELDEFLPV